MKRRTKLLLAAVITGAAVIAGWTQFSSWTYHHPGFFLYHNCGLRQYDCPSHQASWVANAPSHPLYAKCYCSASVTVTGG